jgi:lactate permease
MTLLVLQCLPFVLLVGLLASGRVAPWLAALTAMLAAVPAVVAAFGAATGGFLLEAALRGAWLAAMPVGVVVAGLVFHGAVGAPNAADETPSREKVFAVAFLLGPFLESVTGFAVGVVFALSSLRRMGLAGPAMVAVGLYALLLIPWGGLGPGTFLGAALAGVPVVELARMNAWLSAAWLLPMLVVFWRLAARLGLTGTARTRTTEALWVAALAALLVLANHVMPVELGGIASTGPLLLLRHRALLKSPAAWRRAVPYLVLTAALLGTHAVPALGTPWLRPFADLPGLAPNHAAIVLGAVALLLLAFRADRGAVLAAAFKRAQKPAVAMLLFVVLARVLAGSGIAAALAGRLAAAAGEAAPYAAPVLGALAGFFVGTNVGSNSVTMPLVAALGAGTGLPAALLPAIQNFTGSALCLISPPVLALAMGISGERARPAQIWRVLGPGPLAAVPVAWAAIALWGR